MRAPEGQCVRGVSKKTGNSADLFEYKDVFGLKAEAHGNRTHPGQDRCPTPVLKTGGCTSMPSASKGTMQEKP